MSEFLELVLRNTLNETHSFRFKIHENPVACKWKDLLERTIQSPHRLEKDFCFLGFLESNRSIPYLSEQLNRVIDTLSSYVGEGPWKKGYPIQERLDPENFDPAVLFQVDCHYQFLMGRSWSLSPFYFCAPHEIRCQIQKLNHLIREIEAIWHSKKSLEKNGEIYPFSVVSFQDSAYRPQPLSDEDFEFFSLNRPFGSVGLHYAQTGKTYLDAWRENRESNPEKLNINGLRYYSGQFTVNWGNGPNVSEERIRNIYKDFFAWLNELGFSTDKIQYFVDKKGQKQGIGWIEVATLAEPVSSAENTQKIVSEFNDLWKIRLHLKDRLVEKEYDYRIDDPNH